ncbi:MAG: ACP S-malonyltransferase [Anaerolinea sp.]|nr:ACP S-malonyltransferase [Anaerolinea sp.]
MARALVDRYPAAAEAMAEADDVLGFGLSTLCFEGPEETLTDTINAQPALLAASVAVLRALDQALPGLPAPVAVAGHSMGEYSALVAAGSLSYPDALRLVRERGRLMKEAGQRSPGGMVAILGLEVAQVVALCTQAADLSRGVVQMANDNCPGQTVISGDDQSLELAMDLARQAGAKKVVRLAVSIAAHSPLMAPAAAALRQAVAAIDVRPPAMPVIGNVHAQPLLTVEAIRADLAAQLTESVRWTESMRWLAGQGIDLVAEIGSGDVLTNLMKRIERGVTRLAVGDPEGIERLRAATQD